VPREARPLAAGLLALAALVLSAPAEARPREINQTTAHGRLQRLQPVSFRLLGMGDLDLAVRDRLNQTNLWQFGGVSAGLGLDRDSTSLEMWGIGNRSTTDVTYDGVEEEVVKARASDFAMEGVLRFSETLALGADAGLPSSYISRSYDNASNASVSDFTPVALVMASGRLFGPVLWGLSTPFAGARLSRDWLANQVDGSRIVIGDDTQELAPPNFFLPDEGDVQVNGLGGSIGLQHPQGSQAAFYLETTKEDIQLHQDGQRQVYDTHEERHIDDFGLVVIGRNPDVKGELGVALGRSEFGSLEDYRFSISGGSNALALQGRGDRALKSHRADYFQLRAQCEDVVAGLTLGGDYFVIYQHLNEGPATTEGNFNDFVLTSLTSDTLWAPPLVLESVLESRVLAFGLGASYGAAVRGRPVVVGAEYRWRRNAESGTNVDRRPQGWSLRGGAEWLPHPRWAARAGWVHEVGDADRLTTLNEWLADRLTLGGSWQPGAGWTGTLFGEASWGRTDYPSPGGPLETGWKLGLQVGRAF
jgi:hypothetical protein